MSPPSPFYNAPLTHIYCLDPIAYDAYQSRLTYFKCEEQQVDELRLEEAQRLAEANWSKFETVKSHLLTDENFIEPAKFPPYTRVHVEDTVKRCNIATFCNLIFYRNNPNLDLLMEAERTLFYYVMSKEDLQMHSRLAWKIGLELKTQQYIQAIKLNSRENQLANYFSRITEQPPEYLEEYNKRREHMANSDPRILAENFPWREFLREIFNLIHNIADTLAPPKITESAKMILINTVNSQNLARTSLVQNMPSPVDLTQDEDGDFLMDEEPRNENTSTEASKFFIPWNKFRNSTERDISNAMDNMGIGPLGENINSNDAINNGILVSDPVVASTSAAATSPLSINGGVTSLNGGVTKSNSKSRKSRSEWSQSELNALIEGMKEFGTAWAQIKVKYSSVLSKRTQVHLKDKARSEKERRIKSNYPLGIFEIVKTHIKFKKPDSLPDEIYEIGKVILHTTAGDINMELFAKETPKACRNFVQLCLEGQYDGTIFHRIVSGFIIQGGDPTGTGFGGESIYGAPFADEFHTRLRFVRRGLVAMANSGRNDNRSQFFITLDRADELQNVNTIFGKVVGDTIFNVLKIGELEVDKNERPLYPPKILSTEVIWNPFDDIVPRITVAEKIAQKSGSVTKVEEPSKKKLKKNVALLSFGEEVQEDENDNDSSLKIKSSHDLVENDPRLSKELAVKESEQKSWFSPIVKDKVIEKTKVENTEVGRWEEDSVAFDRKMKENLRQLQEDIMKQEIEQLKQDIKRMDRPKDHDDDVPKKKKAKISYVDTERLRFLSSGKAAAAKRKKGNEADTLAKLQSFKTKIMITEPNVEEPTEGKDEGEPCVLHSVPNCLSCRDTFGQPKEEDTDEGWLTHRLVFVKDYMGKDLMQKRDDPDDYIVIDPLERKKEAFKQEKEKRAKNNSINSETIETPLVNSKTVNPDTQFNKNDQIIDSEIIFEFGGPWGVTAIMLGFPTLMFYLWGCLQFYSGNLVSPFSMELWSQIVEGAAPTWYSAKVYILFCLFEFFLAYIMPGPIIKGVPVSSLEGKQLDYLCNGLISWYATLAMSYILHYYGWFRLTDIINNFGPLMTVAVITGFVITLLIYVVTVIQGKQYRMSGYLMYDLFMGAVLNPRLGRVDLKMFAEIRIPWVILFYVSVSAAIKEYEMFGYVSSSMTFMVLAHFLYVNACAKGEECIPTTWDMTYEK
ncbi:1209_t:CDS:10, partial [Diversispora eburnea]